MKVLDKRGQMNETVVTILVSAVLIIVGIYIFAQVTGLDAIDVSGCTWDNQSTGTNYTFAWSNCPFDDNNTIETFNDTNRTTLSAFNLMPIGLLVLAAVFIIGAIMVLGGDRR